MFDCVLINRVNVNCFKGKLSKMILKATINDYRYRVLVY